MQTSWSTFVQRQEKSNMYEYTKNNYFVQQNNLETIA